MKLFKKKIPFLIVSFVAFIGFFYAPPAHAWSFFDFGADVISDILYSLILTPLSWILAWAGSLVNFAIQPGNLPLTAAENTFVQTGWTAMRDLTNMLFILIMLAIALDYILFNSVGVKRALPRLLLVALLINFSLPIAGVVIDFANVFTDFFIKQVGGPQFTEVFAHKLRLVNIFSAQATQPNALVTINTVKEGTLTSTIFAIFFVLGTTFVLFALAIMFFIRYFYLSILLIVLPLVLVVSILPQLGSHYKKWTSKFISWTMFAPASAFFLYLSMVFLDTQVGTFTETMQKAGWISGFAAQATTFIFAWMLMLASLTTANSMGITGASVAINTFNKGTNWAKKKAAGAGTGAARWAGREAAARAGQAIQPEKLGGRAASIVGGIPLVGGTLSRGARSLGIRAEGAMVKKPAQLTNEEKAKYSEYSGADLLKEAESFAQDRSAANRAKAVSLYEMAANKGHMKILKEDGTTDEQRTNELVKRAYAISKTHKSKSAMEAIIKTNPIVYDEIAQEEWETMAREGKLAEASYDTSTGARRLSGGRRRDTGETFGDAKNKAFEKMGTADFENLKGMWNEQTTKAFLMSGVMGIKHIQMASGTDPAFLDHVSSSLNSLTEKEVMELRRKSPSFASTLAKTGNTIDFLDIEPFRVRYNELKEKEKKGATNETKRSMDEEEDRHL